MGGGLPRCKEWGGVGGKALTESGGTCAGSPGRRASGTGQPLVVWLVRAPPPGQQPAPPQSSRPGPPSSTAAGVAEAPEGRVHPELERALEPRRSGEGGAAGR